MATVASINVALNANTAGYNAALKTAGQTTAAFAAKAQQAGFNSGIALSSLANGAQDFAAVLAQGGPQAFGRALASASNNIMFMAASIPDVRVMMIAMGAAMLMQVAPAIQKGIEGFLGMKNAAEQSADAIEKAFKRDFTPKLDTQKFARDLSQMGSKEAFAASTDKAGESQDLRAELDARRDLLKKTVAQMLAGGELNLKRDGFGDVIGREGSYPLVAWDGPNGRNLDLNFKDWAVSSEEGNKKLVGMVAKLGELNDKLTQTRGHMQEAFKAGRRQEDLEGIRAQLEAWNEFNDAIKHHQDMLAADEINKRQQLEENVLSRYQSESGSTRVATSAISSGSSEAYSVIAASTRTNAKTDIQSLIDVEKRIEVEQKKVRKAIEDLVDKQPIVVSAK